jgi:sugar phosphate isomerase/epimerase
MTRRTFLHRSASALALLAVAPPRLAAAGMFVSLNGAVTAGKNVGWPEFARLAARVGYGGVDWSLAPAQAEGLERTKALFAELNIRPSIANLPMARPFPFGGSDTLFTEALPKLAEDASFNAAAGCRAMMVVLPPTGPVPKDEFRRQVRDRVVAISDVLRKTDTRLGLEFLGVPQFRAARPGVASHPFIWTLPETAALARDCGANIGVVLDVWHWHHSGGTLADIAATDASRIVHVHVSDAKPMAPEDVRDDMRVMPGEGSIDLVGFFQALQKIGYTGGVSPEPLGRIPADMSADAAARLALLTTIAVMKKAGVAIS